MKIGSVGHILKPSQPNLVEFGSNVSFERFILIVYIWRKKITVKHSAQKPELKMNFLVAHFETLLLSEAILLNGKKK
jgi:hypothetical protein